MADYFFAKIKIGGKLNSSQINGIYEIIENKHSEIFNLGNLSIPSDMRERFQNEIELSIRTSDVIHFESDEAKWGEYAYLQEFLEDNKIPYILESGPYYDNPERKRVFNPENNQNSSQILISGEEVVMKRDVNEVIEMLKTNQTSAALKKLLFLCEETNSDIPNAELI
jgi:hypothetical protein